MTAARKTDDRVMMAASEVARRNPMRPPENLPRDGATALRVFWSHPSPLIIAALVALTAGVRLWLAPLGWADLAVAAALLAYFPFNEWLIHVFILHYKPRKLFGRTVDFYLPVTHRRHHADPWNLKWVFVPRHVHALVLPLIALILWLAGPARDLALTGVAVYLLLGLHYEWVHYLTHIPWCPDIGYYQRRVREHRYHHFRNENYWWGVSMGLGDRVLGTAPAAEDVGRSGTTHTVGRN